MENYKHIYYFFIIFTDMATCQHNFTKYFTIYTRYIDFIIIEIVLIITLHVKLSFKYKTKYM